MGEIQYSADLCTLLNPMDNVIQNRRSVNYNTI